MELGDGDGDGVVEGFGADGEIGVVWLPQKMEDEGEAGAAWVGRLSSSISRRGRCVRRSQCSFRPFLRKRLSDRSGYSPFSPDGSLIITAHRPCPERTGPCEESNFVVWDVESRQPVGDPFSASFCFPAFGAAAINTDGTVLAKGSCVGEVTFWDIPSGQSIGDPLPGLEGFDTVVGLRFFERDGRSLMDGFVASHPSLVVWDVTTQPPVVLGRGNSGDTFWFFVHPDGTIAQTLRAGPLELLDPLVFDQDKEAFERLQAFVGHSSSHFLHSASADGTLMRTSAAVNGSTRLWDVESGQQIGDSFGALAAAIQPDGKFMASVRREPGTLPAAR